MSAPHGRARKEGEPFHQETGVRGCLGIRRAGGTMTRERGGREAGWIGFLSLPPLSSSPRRRRICRRSNGVSESLITIAMCAGTPPHYSITTYDFSCTFDWHASQHHSITFIVLFKRLPCCSLLLLAPRSTSRSSWWLREVSRALANVKATRRFIPPPTNFRLQASSAVVLSLVQKQH